MAISRILIDAARFGYKPSRILIDDGEALVQVRLHQRIEIAEFAKEIDEVSREYPTSVLIFDTSGIGSTLAAHWRAVYGSKFSGAALSFEGYRRRGG